MRIKFNGIVEKRSKGCKCRGERSEMVFHSLKSYILPSGITKTFRTGKVEEVSEKDGQFLLSYQYTQDGVVKKVFEVVDD